MDILRIIIIPSWKKRKHPNYSILPYIGQQSAEGHHPLTVEDHYKSKCYEVIYAIVQAKMTRFDKPSFKA